LCPRSYKRGSDGQLLCPRASKSGHVGHISCPQSWRTFYLHYSTLSFAFILCFRVLLSRFGVWKVLSPGYSRCALNSPCNEALSCLTRFLHSLPSRTSCSNSVARSSQYVLPLQVAARMQKRQPRQPASLRAQGNHAVALYDPKCIENIQPPNGGTMASRTYCQRLLNGSREG